MSKFKGCHKCIHGATVGKRDGDDLYTCAKPAANVVVPRGTFVAGWHDWPIAFTLGVIDDCDSYEKRAKLPKRMFREKLVGEYHDLTPEQMGAVVNATRLRDEREKLKKRVKEIDENILKLHDCKSLGHLVHDAPGFPYDIRTCLICGKTELI